MSEWHELIEKINEEAESIIDEYDGQIADLEAEIDDLETLADAADTEAGQEQRDEIERKAATWNPYKPRRRPPWKS